MSDPSLNTLAAALPVAAGGGARVRDFIVLLKPRVMSLVVFTGFAGLYAAPGAMHPFIASVAILAIAVGAGAAGAINMWYDRDIDALMTRTAGRPLPMGRMAPDDALAFGVVLAMGAVMVMGLAVNHVAAALLALAIGFYVFVYTLWLKRRTPQNIVIGGASGAFPPMIGWAAATGEVSLVSIALFLLIFAWTPPHFWALALVKAADYRAAGIPMLPAVAGAAATKRQMLVYTALLVPISTAPWALGAAGRFYLAAALVLGALFAVSAVRVLRDREGTREPMRMFGFSVLYLFAIFAALIADRAAP